MTEEKKKPNESANHVASQLNGEKLLTTHERLIEAVVPAIKNRDLDVKPVIPMSAAPENPKNNGKK